MPISVVLLWVLWMLRHPMPVLSSADGDTNKEGARSPRPPNIILFMTDDQDVRHRSMEYMPKLNQYFRKDGMEFLHYYVPTGLCCPSRTTILRGQYCHNTEIYDNGDLSNATYKSGAWDKFEERGLEEETFVTRLQQDAGYETALVGKYMNGYEEAGHVPPGFDHWMGMMTMSFYGPTFSDNGKEFQANKTVHQTDFILDWATDFLTHKRNASQPFFLMITPFAPHTPATPAKRHEDLFPDVRFPRYESLNPNDEIQRQKPTWIKDMPPLTEQQIDDMDHFYRNRLRSLQGIDEALESLVLTLQLEGLEDNTWFFFTSDNGQHFGDYRITAGKRQAYETDVLVPLLVRGPVGRLEKGATVSQVVQSVDLGPTFLDLATRYSSHPRSTPIQTTYPMDGKSMVSLLIGEQPPHPTTNEFRWAALLEMYGGSSGIGMRYRDSPHFYQDHMFPNTYQAVRVVNGPGWAHDADWLYVEWCTGEQEFYNLTNDPFQVANLVFTKDVGLELLGQLSHLLAEMADCKGPECYEFQLSQPEEVLLGTTMEHLRRLSLETIQQAIRNRLPCFNPVNWTKIDPGLRRKPFAVNLSVPEPFTFGFPFSDADIVPDDLMALWEKYKHYFY